jgi:hypothetical protein
MPGNGPMTTKLLWFSLGCMARDYGEGNSHGE